MIRVLIDQFPKNSIDIFNLLSDFASQTLQFLNIRVVFQKFSPKFHVKIDTILNLILEKHIHILKFNNRIHINPLILRYLLIHFNNFLFNQTFEPIYAELFLNPRLTLLRIHQFIKRFKLIFQLFMLNKTVNQM